MRTIIQKSFKAALDENDILISPAAPSAAYKIGMLLSSFVLVVSSAFLSWWITQLLVMYTGEKKDDPLAMYAGDIMTVSILTLLYVLLYLVFFICFSCFPFLPVNSPWIDKERNIDPYYYYFFPLVMYFMEGKHEKDLN